MSVPDAPLEGRRRFNVGEVKVPHGERGWRELMPDARAADDRRFLDLIGADTADTHARFPASSRRSLTAARTALDAGQAEPWRHLDGARTTFSVDLTDEEAATVAGWSNCRWISEDRLVRLPDWPVSP